MKHFSSRFHSHELSRLVPQNPVAAAEAFLGYEPADSEIKDLREASAPIPGLPADQTKAYVERLFKRDELVRCVSACVPFPETFRFPGLTVTAEKFSWAYGHHKMACSSVICANPVRSKGLGWRGCATDADVTALRHGVVESDSIPVRHQAAVYKRLIKEGLPILSVVYSGSKSLHAIVAIDASDHKDYTTKMTDLYRKLVPIGFDPCVKNVSSLTRLPGSIRRFEDGRPALRQELIYLAPF